MATGAATWGRAATWRVIFHHSIANLFNQKTPISNTLKAQHIGLIYPLLYFNATAERHKPSLLGNNESPDPSTCILLEDALK